MWPLFNTIQLVLLIKFMAISIPANASGMLTKIEDTIELNAIPKEEIKKKIIDHPFVNELSKNGGILLVITIPLVILAILGMLLLFYLAKNNYKVR